jgi:hypothetical protein
MDLTLAWDMTAPSGLNTSNGIYLLAAIAVALIDIGIVSLGEGMASCG